MVDPSGISNAGGGAERAAEGRPLSGSEGAIVADAESNTIGHVVSLGADLESLAFLDPELPEIAFDPTPKMRVRASCREPYCRTQPFATPPYEGCGKSGWVEPLHARSDIGTGLPSIGLKPCCSIN